ncbi:MULTISPECIES: GGDEF domain-containing protein [unclassified Nitratiruptor]|uniref:GGDEF domain-containing protein n=1 Tax=unclassified Nitratiruptor TaxID=2624044 RepID=UPI0019160A10|nr:MULTISPECIES: GGDEF domain-containing protein [unclassified Nitratiruptor]BCD60779.1 diguanylate cyclase [Nitratiruptor sp. YY08-10]BCD64711.1 diguanylate cyclase [Nitratiruptor sp. YY08-14]
MENQKKCQILEKLQHDIRLTKEDLKEIGFIVKKVVSFMVKNDILMTPENYARWFELFCYVQENDLTLSDSEILQYYKQLFQKTPKKVHEIEDEEIRIKLKKIASGLEEKLSQIISTIDTHNNTLQDRTEALQEKENQAADPQIVQYLKEILQNVEELRKENSKLNDQLKKYYEEINHLRRELRDTKNKAEFDYLTELFNRRKFEEYFQKLLQEFNETDGKPFSLIILDIDNFKKINDTYGHLLGDEVLKNLSSLIKTFLHSAHIPARIGGEEFAILLPETSLDEAKIIAERLRKTVENRTIPIAEGDLNFTVSIGVAQVQKGDTMDSLIQRADEALYAAKRNGKNMVIAK